MPFTDEMAQIRRDMDVSIAAIAKCTSRLRADHRQTRDLIAQALKQLADSRELLKLPTPLLEEQFLRQSVLEQAEARVSNSEVYVARQEEIAARLHETGEDSCGAIMLLTALKTALLAHREELTDLRRRFRRIQERENTPRNEASSVTTLDRS